jgi:hypothetical protein
LTNDTDLLTLLRLNTHSEILEFLERILEFLEPSRISGTFWNFWNLPRHHDDVAFHELTRGKCPPSQKQPQHHINHKHGTKPIHAHSATGTHHDWLGKKPILTKTQHNSHTPHK